ncbi:MAG: LysM peptidoglycan-binding domain-containing protein [Candidatus Rifleibacteriota bacterium]
MRQTVRAAGILSLFLLNLSNLSAEPVLRGFFVEKLPKQATTAKLAPGKGLVLAHVFNSTNEAIKGGKYEIGIEIDNAGKTTKFALKPQDSIVAGSIKTFRMAVPVNENVKSRGSFRIFSKIDGKMTWSEKFSFLQGAQSVGENKITTLYTEAPPEPSSITPPAEIQFENEIKTTSQTKTTKVQKVSNSPKLPVKTAPAKELATEVPAKVDVAKVEPKVSTPARKIDPSEFKKLRTIDEELVIYVIKEGDSLKSIAEKYYGSENKERVIADLNFIENPSSVKVGEEIIVDVKPLGKSEEIKKAISKDKIGQAFNGNQKTYTIQKGDTIAKIAKQLLGKTSDAGLLIKANPGLNPNNLKIGDVIVIPETRGDKA